MDPTPDPPLAARTPGHAAAPLPRSALAGYGLAAFPVQMMFLLILLMYLKYAVDDLGASATAVGLIFMLAKGWDAFSDPLVGSWSDRTRSRFGRRRPWLFVSGPLLAVSGYALWSPPEALDGNALTVWIAVFVVAYYTAYTCFDVPHMALGAEITENPAERNKVFGVRQMIRVVGMFAAAGGGVYVVGQHADQVPALAAGLGVATVVFVTLALVWMPRERADYVGRGGENPIRSTRDVFANPHARLVLIVYFIESIGAGGIGVLTPFVIEYVLGMPEITHKMLAFYMLTTLLAVPLWVALARRFEKRHLWLYAMVQGGIGYGLIFWLEEGGWELMALSSLLAGSAGACGNTLGQAIKAEIIDFDEYRTGERKEGAYFAGWSFAGKLAGGIMIGVVGITLDASGYVENALVQTETAKRAMLWLMGGVPLVCFAIGSMLFSRFDLSEAEHARIRRALDERAAAGGGAGWTTTVQTHARCVLRPGDCWEKLSDLSLADRYVPGVKSVRFVSQNRTGHSTSRIVESSAGELQETVVEWNEGTGFLLRLHRGDGPPTPMREATFRYAIEPDGVTTRVVLTMTYAFGLGTARAARRTPRAAGDAAQPRQDRRTHRALLGDRKRRAGAGGMSPPGEPGP